MMPDWVNELDSAPAKPASKDFEDHEQPQERDHRRGPNDRGRGNFNRDRRQGGGSGGGGRGPRRDDRDQNRGRGGDGRRPYGRDQRDGRRDQRPREQLPEGISARVQPSQISLKALVSRIKMSGRAFAMFDLAKVVLGERDRFEVVFRREDKEKGSNLVRCKSDGSVWLTREDAVRHFIESPAVSDYYTVEDTAVEPPKGNFTTIAVCGISGILLGPPNHHAYQTAVLRLHRQRFANMPIERYKSRIRTESDEALIEKWKETQSKVTHYLFPKQEAPPVTEEEAAATPDPTPEEVPAEDAVESPANESEGITDSAEVAAEETTQPAAVEEVSEEVVEEAAEESEAPSAEGAAEMEEADAGEETEPAVAEDAAAPKVERIQTLEALERHVIANLADVVFEERDRAVVPGNIAGKMLAPGLLAILRNEVETLRRSPFPLVKTLCGKLESQGLKIFKRQGKKLFVAKARPRAVDLDTPMSDSVRKIIDVVQAQPGIRVSEMVTSLAPRKPGEDPPKQGELSPEETAVLTDLHWLVDEGFIIEYASSALFLGGQPRHFSEKPKPKTEPKPTGDAKEGNSESESAPVEADAKASEGVESPATAEESTVEVSSVECEPVVAEQVPVETTPEPEAAKPDAPLDEASVETNVPVETVPEPVEAPELTPAGDTEDAPSVVEVVEPEQEPSADGSAEESNTEEEEDPKPDASPS